VGLSLMRVYRAVDAQMNWSAFLLMFENAN